MDPPSNWLVSADLVSRVDGSGEAGRGSRIVARVRSLSAPLDEHALTKIDFFSLDVEGYELPVLRGLDFSRHAPRFILVETANFAAVEAFLSAHYAFCARLSDHDYLFAAKPQVA